MFWPSPQPHLFCRLTRTGLPQTPAPLCLETSPLLPPRPYNPPPPPTAATPTPRPTARPLATSCWSRKGHFSLRPQRALLAGVGWPSSATQSQSTWKDRQQRDPNFTIPPSEKVIQQQVSTGAGFAVRTQITTRTISPTAIKIRTGKPTLIRISSPPVLTKTKTISVASAETIPGL